MLESATVAMIIEMTGSPMRGRRAKRAIATPTSAATPSARPMPSHTGSPSDRKA